MDKQELDKLQRVLQSLNTPSAAHRGSLQGVPALPQSLQLVLWLLSDLSGAGMAALEASGLQRDDCLLLGTANAEALEEMRLLRVTGAAVTQRELAVLLRSRINFLTLTAQTPAQMAAIARAVKTLPDWVWADAAVSDNGAALAPGSLPASGLAEAAHTPQHAQPKPGPTGMGLTAVSTSIHDTVPPVQPAPPLNRHERRALEAQLRKG